MADCSGNGSRGHHGFKLSVWQNGGADIANNKHNVAFQFDLYALANGYDWNFSNSSPVGYKITINGTEYTGDIYQYGGSGTKTIRTGNLDVYHNSDGTKTINFSFSVWDNKNLSYLPGSASGSGSLTLDTIPRYANITGFSVSKRDETSVQVSFNADAGCDWAQYRLNDGNWVDLANSGVISGLSANTSYKFAIRVRRSDSQLWTESWNVWQTTYAYPYCTEAPDFTIGNNATVKFYNPLNRTIKIQMWSHVASAFVSDLIQISGTSYTGFSNVSSRLYSSIPNTTESNYNIDVWYGNNKSVKSGGKYKIIGTEAPLFSNFTYKDSNSNVVAVTGSDQVLIQGLSNLQVIVSSANKMVAQYGATANKYTFSFGNASNSKNYSTSDITSDLGKVTSSGNTRINVVAYDSRNKTKTVYKDINVLKYSKPSINISATRLNNWENQTTIKITGTYEKITVNNVNKNSIDVAKYSYRETGGTWSNWIDLTYTANNGAFTANDVILTLDNTKTFEFQVEVHDKFNTITSSKNIDAGKAILFINKNGRH